MLWCISETLLAVQGSSPEEEAAELGCQEARRWKSPSELTRCDMVSLEKPSQAGRWLWHWEQSPSLRHAAVGNPGTGKPARAGSLNPISKMTLTQKSPPWI